MAREWPGLVGMDLAKDVSLTQRMEWDETTWDWEEGYGRRNGTLHKVVAVDYGLKRNILRCLTAAGCEVTVRAGDRQRRGHPGDEARRHVSVERPGRSGGNRRICGARDQEAGRLPASPSSASASAIRCWRWRSAPRRMKMHQGHHGANHPVKDFTTGKVEITSMNHGFTVDRDTPAQRRRRDACLALRRLELRHRRRGQADLLGAVSPGGLARPAGQPLSLQALRRGDGQDEKRLKAAS